MVGGAVGPAGLLGRLGLAGAILAGAQATQGRAAPQAALVPRPKATGPVFRYEDRAVGTYRFQGYAVAGGESGRGDPVFHSYRILRRTSAGRLVPVRIVRAAELALGSERPGPPVPSGGLFFLAFQAERREAYLAWTVDAARVVTREAFAVGLAARTIRSLGIFSTAGEVLSDIRLSPSGSHLAFLALCGNRVLQGLTVLRLDSEQVQDWPDDGEVRAFRAQFPDWALQVTDYRWCGAYQILFRQRIQADPEAQGGPAPPVPPAAQHWELERIVDVREGRVLQEHWQPAAE